MDALAADAWQGKRPRSAMVVSTAQCGPSAKVSSHPMRRSMLQARAVSVRVTVMMRDEVEAAVRTADVVVLNWGLHYQVMKQYSTELRDAFALLEAHAKQPRNVVVFQETGAQHFKASDSRGYTTGEWESRDKSADAFCTCSAPPPAPHTPRAPSPRSAAGPVFSGRRIPTAIAPRRIAKGIGPVLDAAAIADEVPRERCGGAQAMGDQREGESTIPSCGLAA